jgi:hypothetical protein
MHVRTRRGQAAGRRILRTDHKSMPQERKTCTQTCLVSIVCTEVGREYGSRSRLWRTVRPTPIDRTRPRRFLHVSIDRSNHGRPAGSLAIWRITYSTYGAPPLYLLYEATRRTFVISDQVAFRSKKKKFSRCVRSGEEEKKCTTRSN